MRSEASSETLLRPHHQWKIVTGEKGGRGDQGEEKGGGREQVKEGNS